MQANDRIFLLKDCGRQKLEKILWWIWN